MKHKEPLLRIARRDGLAWWKAWMIRLGAVVLALLVCAGLIYSVTSFNPADVYRAMFDGALGAPRRIWNTLRDTALLLGISIAITPAFKMRFWNIGAEGQVLAGAIAAAAVMRYGVMLPPGILFLLMIAASVLAGVIWGMIPAAFKACWNTNETLFTLMMNYVAVQFAAFFSILWEAKKGSGSVGTINGGTKIGWIPNDFLSGIFGNFNYSIAVLIVLGITVLMYVYLRYTKHGYEISVVGESENTARYAGISVKKVIMRTMALSGAISGLIGFLIVSGSSHTISTNTAGGRGFTAIVVSWLAKFNPFAMIVISFFLTFMEKGAVQIASRFHLDQSASDVLTGIVLFFILGCEFFINYRIIFRGKEK